MSVIDLNNSVRISRITEKGLKDLGKLIRDKRGHKSLDDFIYEIRVITGEKLSKSALSYLERGVTEPRFSTLSILSASVLQEYSVYDLFAIACEEYEFK
jgi:hypothetical protein